MFRSGGGLLSESEPHGFGLYSDGGAWRFKAELLQPGMNSAEDGEPAERCRAAGVRGNYDIWRYAGARLCPRLRRRKCGVYLRFVK